MVRDNIKDVIKAIEEIVENLVNWFSNNEMKNTDKYHLLLNNQESNMLKIGDLDINISLSEKLLRISSQKLNALARFATFMGTTRKRILMNAFFKSQFNYCPLAWMHCNRSLNTKINQLHER